MNPNQDPICLPQDVSDAFQQALISASNSGEFAAFVVWHDREAGMMRLQSCHIFPEHAISRLEMAREMISAKIGEFLARIVPRVVIPGMGPLPPGTKVGPEMSHRMKVGRQPNLTAADTSHEYEGCG